MAMLRVQIDVGLTGSSPIKDKSHIKPGLPVTNSDRGIGKEKSIQDEDLALLEFTFWGLLPSNEPSTSHCKRTFQRHCDDDNLCKRV